MSWKTDRIAVYETDILHKELRNNLCPKQTYEQNHKTPVTSAITPFLINPSSFQQNFTTYTHRYNDSGLKGGVQTTGAHEATDFKLA